MHLFKYILISINLHISLGKLDPILYCDLCKAIISEARLKIHRQPPDQKVRVTTGGSRLTSNGELKTKTKLLPKIRSDEFLEYLFEEYVCDELADNYLKWFDKKPSDPNKRQWRISRVTNINDGKMNLNIDMDYIEKGQGDAREIREKDPEDRTRSMRMYCAAAIEEMEEELFDVFQIIYDETGEVHAHPSFRVCYEQKGWCGKEDAKEMFRAKKKKKVKAGQTKDEL